jgi:hypothetical protein
MARSGEAFLRQWHVLGAVPRAPVAIESETVVEALVRVGIETDLATVERDLKKLSKLFPLRRDARSARPLWSWASDAPSWEFPGMDAAAALVLSVVLNQARAILPKGALGLLAPMGARTQDVLGAIQDRLRVLPWGPPVGPPNVEASVLVPVLLALREGRVLDVRYPRTENEPVRLKVHPYGLVVREGRLYLVAGVNGLERPLILVLHRVSRAQILDEAAAIPEDLDLDAYLQEGAPGFSEPDPIDVVLRFEPEIGPALVDARFDGIVELLEEEDGTWLFRAHLPDSSQLRAWILSYGTFVEVVEPPALRDWVAEQAVAMSERYL